MTTFATAGSQPLQRKQVVSWVVAAVALVSALALAYVAGTRDQPSSFVHVDHDVSGSVVKVSVGNPAAVVLDSGGENKSYVLLTGTDPKVGQRVSGTVVNLIDGNESTEGIILR